MDEKKKGFLKDLIDKLDKKMKEKSKQRSCCCCGPSDSCGPSEKQGKC